MPELPEVETIRRGLENSVTGRKILKIEYDVPKLLLPSPQKVEQAAIGTKITDIKRIGKLLLISLSNGKKLGVHLKLTGRLLVRKKGSPKDDWQHVTMILDQNLELRFSELRKFGYIKLIDSDNELKKILSEFGPEPLTPDFSLEAFKKIISGKKKKIKEVLMDQKNMAGIGNIYADESLFAAKIHPERLSNSLTSQEMETLHKEIERILKEAIKYRGTSVDSYRDTEGNKGDYGKFHKVFRLEGKPCPICGTIIKKIRVGGRGTHFCPNCQKI